VKITTPLRFDLVIANVGAGMFFRQAAKAIQNAYELTHVPKLAGVTDGLVGNYLRVHVAVALQRVASVMQCDSTWGYAISGDASTHRGHSFFDMRVRL